MKQAKKVPIYKQKDISVYVEIPGVEVDLEGDYWLNEDQFKGLADLRSRFRKLLEPNMSTNSSTYWEGG